MMLMLRISDIRRFAVTGTSVYTLSVGLLQCFAGRNNWHSIKMAADSTEYCGPFGVWSTMAGPHHSSPTQPPLASGAAKHLHICNKPACWWRKFKDVLDSGRHRLDVSTCREWNSLPSALRDSSLSLNTFKRRLKTYLFGQSRMPPGAVVAIRVILAPDINVTTYLLTYLCNSDTQYRMKRFLSSNQHCSDIVNRTGMVFLQTTQLQVTTTQLQVVHDSVIIIYTNTRCYAWHWPIGWHKTDCSQ